jgi:hypothetical protein
VSLGYEYIRALGAQTINIQNRVWRETQSKWGILRRPRFSSLMADSNVKISRSLTRNRNIQHIIMSMTCGPSLRFPFRTYPIFGRHPNPQNFIRCLEKSLIVTKPTERWRRRNPDIQPYSAEPDTQVTQ